MLNGLRRILQSNIAVFEELKKQSSIGHHLHFLLIN